VLSRAAKKTKVIASSKSWMRLAAKAKGQPDPYHTAWLDRSKFRDWKKYLDERYERPSVWTNTLGETVPLMKIRWFNFGVGEQTAAGGAVALVAHPDEVWYRLSLDASEPWKTIALVRRAGAGGVISDAEYDLHTAALSLPPEKVADLAKFKKWLPRRPSSMRSTRTPARRRPARTRATRAMRATCRRRTRAPRTTRGAARTKRQRCPSTRSSPRSTWSRSASRARESTTAACTARWRQGEPDTFD